MNAHNTFLNPSEKFRCLLSVAQMFYTFRQFTLLTLILHCLFMASAFALAEDPLDSLQKRAPAAAKGESAPRARWLQVPKEPSALKREGVKAHAKKSGTF